MVTTDDTRIRLDGNVGDINFNGITVRTWMATQFVAAFISGAQASGDMISAEGTAQAAVSMANTLIAELNK